MRPFAMSSLRTVVLLLLIGLVSPALAANENHSVPQGVQRPLDIHLAVRILNVLKIDETAGEAALVIEVEQRWRDPSLVFDAIKAGGERQDFAGSDAATKLASIWTPALVIENQVNDPRLQLEAVAIHADGGVVLTRRLEGSYRFSKDLSAFPFDRQRLPLSFVSQYFSADDLVFINDDRDRQLSPMPGALSASDWTASGLNFKTQQFYGWSAKPFARLTVELDVARKWPRYFLRIFVPFIAVLSVSLFILWAPTGLIGDKAGTTYSALLALAALSFTFEASFPGSMSVTSPIAFMISIGYFYLILALLIDLFIESRGLPGRQHYPYLSAEVRKSVRTTLPALFCIICICITLRSLV